MTPTQEKVCAICAEILGLERVDVDDNLYEVGSDSHQAILVALEIERVFEVSLPLEVMETNANVRALAAWIDEQHDRQQSGAAAPVDAQAGSNVDG